MRKYISLFILLVYAAATHAQKTTSSKNSESYLLVGTYTSGKSKGLQVYKFNSNTGNATFVSEVQTSNPSYLTVSPNGKYVYAVNEDGGQKVHGKVSAFSFDKTKGNLSLINSQSVKGDYPCYIAINKQAKWLTVANYGTGNIVVLPVEANGAVGEYVTNIQHKGSSLNKERQEGPHVHTTVFSPDEKYLLANDLGTDKIMVYQFNHEYGNLTPASPAYEMVKPGDGPRHMAFHPSGKYLYVLTELTGEVIIYKYESGKLLQIENLPTLPRDYTGEVGAADIHVSPDRKFLYTSNRGNANLISIFAIDATTGKLTIKGYQSTLGKTPRNFNFDPTGNYLLVANQNSDNIVIFKRDKTTGLLSDTGKRIDTGNPVCIKWITK